MQAAGCFWCFSVSLTPLGNSTIQMHVPYVKEIPDIPISSGTKKTGSSSQHSTGGMKMCCKWPLYMPVIISKKICMNVASLSNRHLAMWQSNRMSPNNRAFRCHRFLWTVSAAFHPRSPHSSGHRPVLGNKALPKKKREPTHWHSTSPFVKHSLLMPENFSRQPFTLKSPQKNGKVKLLKITIFHLPRLWPSPKSTTFWVKKSLLSEDSESKMRFGGHRVVEVPEANLGRNLGRKPKTPWWFGWRGPTLQFKNAPSFEPKVGRSLNSSSKHESFRAARWRAVSFRDRFSFWRCGIQWGLFC